MVFTWTENVGVENIAQKVTCMLFDLFLYKASSRFLINSCRYQTGHFERISTHFYRKLPYAHLLILNANRNLRQILYMIHALL